MNMKFQREKKYHQSELALQELPCIEHRPDEERGSEQRKRDFYARVWREARRDYFFAEPNIRSVIFEAWKNWAGPRTCIHYRYVVDLHTGIL